MKCEKCKNEIRGIPFIYNVVLSNLRLCYSCFIKVRRTNIPRYIPLEQYRMYLLKYEIS